jgi:hypothetical protein
MQPQQLRGFAPGRLERWDKHTGSPFLKKSAQKT